MNSISQPLQFLHRSSFLRAFGVEAALAWGTDSVVAAPVTRKYVFCVLGTLPHSTHGTRCSRSAAEGGGGGCLVPKSCLTLCNPMDPCRFLCPWDLPGKNTGRCCHFLLPVDFPDPALAGGFSTAEPTGKP